MQRVELTNRQVLNMITYINKGLAMAGVGGHIISFENSKDKIYKIDKDFIKQYVENVWIVSTKERKARENVIKELHGLQRYFNEIEFPYGLIYFDGVYAGNIQKFYYDYTTLRSCLTDKSLTDCDKLYVLNYVLALIKKFEEHQITYADLHPSNIMIKRNSIKLIDFDDEEHVHVFKPTYCFESYKGYLNLLREFTERGTDLRDELTEYIYEEQPGRFNKDIFSKEVCQDYLDKYKKTLKLK